VPAANQTAGNLAALQATVVGAGNSRQLATAAQSAASTAAANATVVAVQTAVNSGGLVAATGRINTAMGTTVSSSCLQAWRDGPMPSVGLAAKPLPYSCMGPCSPFACHDPGASFA
jgi:hypothetical protein